RHLYWWKLTEGNIAAGKNVQRSEDSGKNGRNDSGAGPYIQQRSRRAAARHHAGHASRNSCEARCPDAIVVLRYLVVRAPVTAMDWHRAVLGYSPPRRGGREARAR